MSLATYLLKLLRCQCLGLECGGESLCVANNTLSQATIRKKETIEWIPEGWNFAHLGWVGMLPGTTWMQGLLFSVFLMK